MVQTVTKRPVQMICLFKHETCRILTTVLFLFIFLHKLEVSPSDNEPFCSTWGSYHFKTFDGGFFRLPSTCNYILTSQCVESYENFNIQLQRQETNGLPTIKKVTMKLEGALVELDNTSIKVDNKLWVCPILINRWFSCYSNGWCLLSYSDDFFIYIFAFSVTTPFSQVGISIVRSVSYVKIKSKLGLIVMWNEKDSLWVCVFIVSSYLITLTILIIALITKLISTDRDLLRLIKVFWEVRVQFFAFIE